MKPRLIDLRKASAEFDPSYGYFYALVQKGVLPVVRIPGCRRIFIGRADFERLIDQHKETVAA